NFSPKPSRVPPSWTNEPAMSTYSIKPFLGFITHRCSKHIFKCVASSLKRGVRLSPVLKDLRAFFLASLRSARQTKRLAFLKEFLQIDVRGRFALTVEIFYSLGKLLSEPNFPSTV